MLRLETVVYELTGACNQCCRFCYNYWRDGSHPIPAPDPRMAGKTLKKLLREASIGTISFSGGEPLLLGNVHDLVLRARFKGCRVNILTNGTLLSEDSFRNFMSLGVSTVQIPLLSADPSVHDCLTNLPGSWPKAVKALRMASEKAAAVLVITKVNIPYISKTLELIQDCGVRTVMVNRFNIGGQGLRNVTELVPGREELADAFASVEAFASAHPEMTFVSGVCTPLCYLDTGRYPHIRFSTCSTDISKRPVTVSFSGDVRFCNHSPKVLGNIHEKGLEEILSESAAVQWYSQIPDKCASCALLKRCGGGCRAAAEQVFGTFAHEDPILDFE